MGPRVVPSLLLGLATCGPEIIQPLPLEPLELLPICGQPSPFRLLALEEGQTPIEKDHAVYRFGDRIYFVVGRAPDMVANAFDPYWIGHDTSLYSTGPCGESPRLVAHDVPVVFEEARLPGWLLGITNRGKLVVLDPEGEAEPRVLLEDPLRGPVWTDYGLLTIDEGRDALLLRAYPTAPDEAMPEPTVIVEPFASDTPWGARGNDVFFVEDGALHRIELRDGSRTVELSGDIDVFNVSADGRFVVWQSPPDADGYRSVRVYDRQRGTGEPIGETNQHVWLHDDYVVILPRDRPHPSHRLVVLPSMEQLDVPDSVLLGERIDDTRWIAGRWPERWFVYDRTTNAVEPLFEELGERSWYYEDRLEVLVDTFWSDSGYEKQGRLYAAWFDDRRSAPIVDRATPGHHHLADGRVVTPLDVHDMALGTLVLTDLAGRTRWVIDRETVAWFGRFQAAAGYEDDVVVYGVSDGDRSGVWLARLPPAE